jgi:hypothetical protein
MMQIHTISNKGTMKWKKGNTVWVWDEAPADDDGEGDMTWDVFKGKIVKFTAGKKDGEYEIQFGKERYWYSDDDMFPTQSAASIALDAKLEAEGN